MNIIILCGKAGSGKNFILDLILNRYKGKNLLNYLRLDTTRPPRPSEINEIDYNFLSLGEFQRKPHICKESFITGEGVNWAQWWYGLPENSLKKDKINLGILSPFSLIEFYKLYPITKIFYINADPAIRLNRQMKREKNPDYSEICRRYLADEKDFKQLETLPYEEIYNGTFPVPNASIESVFSYIDRLAKGDKGNMS